MRAGRFTWWLSAATLAIACGHAGLHAMWAIGEVKPGHWGYDLIVTGKVSRLRRDLVGYKGSHFARVTAELTVDKVLLKPQDMAVGSHLSLTWATKAGLLSTGIELWQSRHAHGAWLVSRTWSGGDWYVYGLEERFFVPDAKMNALLTDMRVWPPYEVRMFDVRGRALLRIRYLNPTDAPRTLPAWRVTTDAVFAPEGSMLEVYRSVGEDERDVRLRSRPVRPAEVETIAVQPGCHAEAVHDVTDLIGYEPSGPQEYPWRFEAYVEGKPAHGPGAWGYVAWPEDQVQELAGPDEVFYLVGPAGRVVWWFPSAGKIRLWLLVAAPLVAFAGLRARRRGRAPLAYAGLGVWLGLAWAWAVAAWGPEATAAVMTLLCKSSAELRALSAGLGPTDMLRACGTRAVLLLLPAVAAAGAIATRKRRRAPGIWLVWPLWLGIPVAAVIVNLMLLGPADLV